MEVTRTLDRVMGELALSFEGEAWARGRAGFEQGRVIELEPDPLLSWRPTQRWRAFVEGGRRTCHDVEVRFEVHRRTLVLLCRCDCEASEPCEHMAAVVIAVFDRFRGRTARQEAGQPVAVSA
jgi:uncharacterized Zn finger protein